ncbi:MAG: DUF1080 domain-containing protein [Fuerstiella sp.]|nr:DUF1080 domain-containing protein [Fuerstiella sp.]
MKFRCSLFVLHLLAFACCFASIARADDEWQNLFDGKTLNGWDGDPRLWSVEDGAITGETTPEIKLKQNSFIIWRGGDVDNFELELEYRIIGTVDRSSANSGIQYRSFEVPDSKWLIGGYQADFEAGDTYSGILYGERFRGILAERGQSTELTVRGGKFVKTVVQQFADGAELQKEIRKDDWNSYRIEASGHRFKHYINGHKTIECVDNDLKQRRSSGVLAFQIHVGKPMKVQFRNIRLKKLPVTKRVAMISGTPSHGFGSHEHRAGCMLLAEALNNSRLDIEASVYTDGWPKDETVLDYADAIVIYADGGAGHPFNEHLERLRQIQNRGVGMACIHYGVEVPTGDSGDAIRDWIGGYFETHWSVNPHWTASFDRLPSHPIARGVRPFTIHDEWYYHMRFVNELTGVTPILTDLPPADSLSRDDGPHSNNEYVRAAVLERQEPQHVAWAHERSDGGRGFGFTGGHFHWNWGNANFRKLVLNAIAWTAHAEIPTDGISSGELSIDELIANQDYPVPDNFNKARIEALLREWNGT